MAEFEDVPLEERLISLVRQHDHLYNTSTRSCKNAKLRDETWAVIAWILHFQFLHQPVILFLKRRPF